MIWVRTRYSQYLLFHFFRYYKQSMQKLNYNLFDVFIVHEINNKCAQQIVLARHDVAEELTAIWECLVE